MKKLVILFLFITGFVYSQNTNITFIPTGGKTLADLQSPGTAVQIIQDKSNPQNLHAVYMTSPYSDSITFNQRTVKYYFSSDFGQTWNFVRELNQISKAGFPSVSVLSNGSAIISLHGNAPKKSYTFADLLPGLGSFTELGTSDCFGRTPQVLGLNYTSQLTKFYLINSAGFSRGLSVSQPSFSPCMEISGLNPDSYSIAAGSDGRVGIAYIIDPAQLEGNSGDVFFMESTDEGVTFSTPVKLYDAVINTEESFFVGAFRGISLVYSGNTPNVVFEIAKQTLASSFYPKAPGGIVYWSPNNPGANPNKCKYIARNDSCNSRAYIPFYPAYGNDVLSSICRPSIGSFSDTNFMAVVFMSSTQNIRVNNFDTICYNALYMTYSHNKGNTWTRPKKISPDELMDWAYPSVSQYNFSPAFPYKANVTATRDTIPGSYMNNSSFGKSMAEQYFFKLSIGSTADSNISTFVSGNVRYSDDNQVVTNGVVKAIKFDSRTGETLIISTSQIDANGNYMLDFTGQHEDYYIVAYPNSEKQSDYIVTYFPSTLEWENATKVNSGANNTNINVRVFRKTNDAGESSISGTTIKAEGTQTSVLPDVFVIFKRGKSYAGFTKTDKEGKYFYENLAEGNYEILTTKLGFSSIKKNIFIKSGKNDSVNLSLTQIIKEQTFVTGGFYLYQNYPNPFNPVSKIKFDVPKASFVKIIVYDVLGRQISTLLNETKQTGSYTVDFDASSLSSGVYYYRLETGNFAETKRMVILK
ncbi:MAG: T9SS type A sorting domain-containing protein [Ignavibacteria bacterium]|nr:T9SS type A sorting domain-containing protein [Ignavibacteria bacterium]